MTVEERTPGRLRRDARLNREAILEAGRELFADSADVAMCQVAKRAGVGQATLYRNFPDRGALAAEILGERVERIVELAADHEDDPDAFFVLLRSVVDSMAGVYALAELAREDARTDERLKQNRLVVAELMKKPMRDAKAAGTLRRDLFDRRCLPDAVDGARRYGGRAGRRRPHPGGPPGAGPDARRPVAVGPAVIFAGPGRTRIALRSRRQIRMAVLPRTLPASSRRMASGTRSRG